MIGNTSRIKKIDFFMFYGLSMRVIMLYSLVQRSIYKGYLFTLYECFTIHPLMCTKHKRLTQKGINFKLFLFIPTGM